MNFTPSAPITFPSLMSIQNGSNYPETDGAKLHWRIASVERGINPCVTVGETTQRGSRRVESALGERSRENEGSNPSDRTTLFDSGEASPVVLAGEASPSVDILERRFGRNFEVRCPICLTFYSAYQPECPDCNHPQLVTE